MVGFNDTWKFVAQISLTLPRGLSHNRPAGYSSNSFESVPFLWRNGEMRTGLPLLLFYLFLPAGGWTETVTVYLMDNGIRPDHKAFAGMEIESVDLLGAERGEGGAESKGQGGKTSEQRAESAERRGESLERGAKNLEQGVWSKERGEGSLETVPAFGEHGTLLAGLVVERAPKVRLVSVRTLDEKGEGKWSDFIRGVHWIANHHEPGKPAVANLSLGGVPEASRIRRLVSEAVDQLAAAGVVVIVAAGNEGADLPGRIPSTLDSVISVGAWARLGGRLRNSNYGTCADLFALGENLRGPSARSRRARQKDSGSSLAAAVVTGHVAAYLTGHPGASPAAVKSWVLENSPDGVFQLR